MSNLKSYIFIVISVFLTSCVAVQPFPYAVRAGDTITLAIGSLDGVDKNNMTITYYPAPGSLPSETPVDVTGGIRSIFNIYPDRKSKTFWDTTSGGGLETIEYVELSSGHSAWQTVVAVDLPVDLPVGSGHFVVTPGAGAVYPGFISKVDDVKINAQILEPGGDAHTFEYRKFNFNTSTSIGDLSDLEQLRQVVVRNITNASDATIAVAAAEYDLQVPVVDQSLNDVSDLVPDSDVAVILDDQMNYLSNQTSLYWSRSGASIKVVITSTVGNQDANLLRFSILLANYTGADLNGWSLADNASLISVKYFDLNGDEISGLVPDVVVQ